MLSWFEGRFRWPKNRSSLLANATIFGASVAGIWVTVPDVFVKIIGSSISFGASFLAARHISRFTVPQAFAIGYFKSFVEPVGNALKFGKGDIVYTDNTSGIPAKIVLDPEKVKAVLNIVIPKDLAPETFEGQQAKDGLSKSIAALDSKKEGTMHLPTRKRGYTVHFELGKDQGMQTLKIYDVPFNLNPLGEIVHGQGQEEDQSSQEEATEARRELDRIALKEYSAQLNNSLPNFLRGVVDVFPLSVTDNSKHLRENPLTC